MMARPAVAVSAAALVRTTSDLDHAKVAGDGAGAEGTLQRVSKAGEGRTEALALSMADGYFVR